MRNTYVHLMALFGAATTVTAASLGGCTSVETATPSTLEAGTPQTPIPTSEAGVSCGALATCGGECVDTKNDPANCGTCGTKCGADQVCSKGACATSCPSSQVKCDVGGKPLCVTLDSDRQHCGACGTACASGELCSAGKCALSCQASYTLCSGAGAGGDAGADGGGSDAGDSDAGADAGASDGGTSDAGLAQPYCANLQTSEDDCGACGNACALGDHCSSGVCCAPSETACGGVCKNTASDPANCGTCGKACAVGEGCSAGACNPYPHNFNVLERKDVTYSGIDYHAVKVSLKTTSAAGDTWCADYMNLCRSLGALPTGCGSNFTNGNNGYGVCKTTYMSDGTSNTLNCNPSSGVSAAAVSAGFTDATSTNSFGFHFCSVGEGTCTKVWCSGTYCNTALSYYDTSQPHGYTLCKKP